MPREVPGSAGSFTYQNGSAHIVSGDLALDLQSPTDLGHRQAQPGFDSQVEVVLAVKTKSKSNASHVECFAEDHSSKAPERFEVSMPGRPAIPKPAPPIRGKPRP